MAEEANDTKIGSVWTGLLCGAVAGLTSKCVVYPMDTVKALLQLQGANQQQRLYHNTWDVCRKVSSSQGLAGFYRGFGAILVGVVPANIAYYGGYELGKKLFGDTSTAKDMAVGAAAQILAGLVYTPIDIVKERLQVQRIMGSTYSYQGPVDALSSMWRTGGINGVLRGYWANNAVWLPWNIMYISLYEKSKRYMAAQHSGTQRTPNSLLPVPVLALCSMGSAAAAAVATHPVDVIKTRLQVLSAVHKDITFREVAWELFSKQGAKGLGSGLTARILNIAPGCALSWMMYEKLKEWADQG